MRLAWIVCGVCVSVLLYGAAAGETTSKQAKQSKKTRGAEKNQGTRVVTAVKDDPSLPRVLLIGDSITMGYSAAVRAALKGKANVHLIPENGATTANGLKKLKTWLGAGKWDVIHFNWGLHDTKIMKDGKYQVPIGQYEKNLRELVTQLKATDAKLIWASTTPVLAGELNPVRKQGAEVEYNAVAKKVMDENRIMSDDLHAFALPQLAEIQTPANVHFSPKGSEILGKHVASCIEPFLSKKGS